MCEVGLWIQESYYQDSFLLRIGRLRVMSTCSPAHVHTEEHLRVDINVPVHCKYLFLLFWMGDHLYYYYILLITLL